ncbi:MAG: hypothetical protein SFU98_02430 [Leptospiraceae bacterium]|nr:hypothetical protein [Leptospiraceae bacterium]
MKSCFSLFLLLIFLFFDCSRDDKNLSTKYEKALSLFNQHKLEQSLKIFLEIEQESSSYRNIDVYIGKIYYYQIELNKAESYFVNAIQKDKNDINPFFWLIKTEYLQKKNPEKLLSKINYYLTKDSNNQEILYLRANVCKSLNKFEDAIKSYERIISSSDKLVYSYLELGKIYKDAGDFKKADSYLKSAKVIAEINPYIKQKINFEKESNE